MMDERSKAIEPIGDHAAHVDDRHGGLSSALMHDRRMAEELEAIDDDYLILMAQLGASLFNETCHDPYFRAGRMDLYEAIERCEIERERQRRMLAAAKRNTVEWDDEYISTPSTKRPKMPCDSRVSGWNAPSRERDRLICSSCGALTVDGDAFCGSCGAPLVRVAGQAHLSSTDEFDDGRTGMNSSKASRTPGHAMGRSERQKKEREKIETDRMRKMIGIVDVLAVLSTMLPWVNINLYLWSGSYSLIGLVQLIMQVNNGVSSILGSNYTSSGYSAGVAIVMGVIAFFWIIVCFLLLYDAYAKLFKRDSSCSLTAMGGFVFLAFLVIACAFALDLFLSYAASSIMTISGIFTATLFAWLCAVGGVVFIVYANSKKAR